MRQQQQQQRILYS